MRTVIFEEGVAPKPFLLFSADIVDTDGENACKVVGTLNVTRYGFGIKFNKRQPHGKAMVINRDMKRSEEAIADARNYIIEKFGMTLDNEKTYKPKPSYRDFKDHTFTDETAEEAKVAVLCVRVEYEVVVYRAERKRQPPVKLPLELPWDYMVEMDK